MKPRIRNYLKRNAWRNDQSFRRAGGTRIAGASNIRPTLAFLLKHNRKHNQAGTAKTRQRGLGSGLTPRKYL